MTGIELATLIRLKGYHSYSIQIFEIAGHMKKKYVLVKQSIHKTFDYYTGNYHDYSEKAKQELIADLINGTL